MKISTIDETHQKIYDLQVENRKLMHNISLQVMDTYERVDVNKNSIKQLKKLLKQHKKQSV